MICRNDATAYERNTLSVIRIDKGTEVTLIREAENVIGDKFLLIRIDGIDQKTGDPTKLWAYTRSRDWGTRVVSNKVCDVFTKTNGSPRIAFLDTIAELVSERYGDLPGTYHEPCIMIRVGDALYGARKEDWDHDKISS